MASRRDFTYTIPGGPAAEASILWGLTGPLLVLVGPLHQAEEEAVRLVRWGRAERMISLGIDAPSASEPAIAVAAAWLRV